MQFLIRKLGASLAALLSMLLMACSSLPQVTPSAGQGVLTPPATPPRLQGARGALSAAHSKQVLDRLQKGGRVTDIFERHLAIEEAIVGSPLTTGNQVLLLQDGPATYAAMFTAIAAAQDHINLETYIFEDDEIGQRFADALIAKQAQGVQVNVIRDSVGTLGTPIEFYQKLQASGIKVLEFNPANPLRARTGWQINQRDHRKLLIVDGHTAFLGGINISSVYSVGSSGGSFSQFSKASGQTNALLGWRDTDVQLQGPVVAEFQKLFLATWQKQQGTPLAAKRYFPPLASVGQHVVRAIGSAPDEPYSLIYATLLSAIGSAEATVYITNAYFAPDPQLLAALEGAAARGVDVRLILPSRTDSSLVFHAGRSYYSRLLRAGVKIYQLKDAVLHSKTVLIDGVWATVGSTNLDWRSFLHNYELNAVVLGAQFGAQVKLMFDKDLSRSEPLSLEAWERRPLDLRLKEIMARVWEYWL